MAEERLPRFEDRPQRRVFYANRAKEKRERENRNAPHSQQSRSRAPFAAGHQHQDHSWNQGQVLQEFHQMQHQEFHRMQHQQFLNLQSFMMMAPAPPATYAQAPHYMHGFGNAYAPPMNMPGYAPQQTGYYHPPQTGYYAPPQTGCYPPPPTGFMPGYTPHQHNNYSAVRNNASYDTKKKSSDGHHPENGEPSSMPQSTVVTTPDFAVFEEEELPSPSRLFKPGSVRCHEIREGSSTDDTVAEKRNGKSVAGPSSIDHPTSLSGRKEEPSLKRKVSIETPDAVKKSKSNNGPPLEEHPLKRSEPSLSGTDADAVIEEPKNQDVEIEERQDLPNSPRSLLTEAMNDAETIFQKYNSFEVCLGQGTRYSSIFDRSALNRFAFDQWYSASTFVICRSVMEIPQRFIFVTPEEGIRRQKLTEKTKDVVWVHQIKGNHWVLVHLSIDSWQVVYYDSLSHQNASNDSDMMEFADLAELDVRTRRKIGNVVLPRIKPPVKHRCTIRQTDTDSCGPFVLREIELLFGIRVQDDFEDPVLIRSRHLNMITAALRHGIASASRKLPIQECPPMHGRSSPELPPQSMPMDTSPSVFRRPSHASEYSESVLVRVPMGRRERGPKAEDDMRVKNPIPKLLQEIQSDINEIPLEPRPKPSYKQYYPLSKMTPDDSESDSSLFIPENESEEGEDEDPDAFDAEEDEVLNVFDAAEDEDFNASDAAEDEASSIFPTLADQEDRSEDDEGLVMVSREPEPRPSDQVIASLSPEQLRQAWKSVHWRILRYIARDRGMKIIRGVKKPALIQYLMDSRSKITLVARWEFLRRSRYEGQSKTELLTLGHLELYLECKRLGIRTDHTSLKSALADRIIDFIRTNGTSHEPDISNRLTKRSLEKQVQRNNKYRARELEKRRLPMVKGPNFSGPVLDLSCPTLVIIISRTSGLTPWMDDKWKSEHDIAERMLKTGYHFPGLEDATYKHLYFSGVKLHSSLPSRHDVKRRDCHREMQEMLIKAEDGSQIVFVSLGIDGMSADIPGWQNFIGSYQYTRAKKLDIYVIFGEHYKQWHANSVPWNKDDWLGPQGDRYWVCCEAEGLVDVNSRVRVYQQIQEQWAKCIKGRLMRSAAIAEEGRPVTGRSGSPKPREKKRWK